MATPPTFTAGQILTAAQMNAAGLWRVTGCTVTSAGGTAATASNGVVTIGTGNTSITVSNAFSSDYANYKILINGGTASTGGAIGMTFGSVATGYYGALIYVVVTTAGVQEARDNNATKFTFATYSSTTSGIVGGIDVFGPQQAKWTIIEGSYTGGNNAGKYYGSEQSTTQHTAFTLTPSAGTLTGGTIRVYGYN